MKRSLLSLLSCPSCRTGYELTEHAAADGDVSSGFLTCESCAIVVPIVRGFPLFTEPRLHAGQASAEELALLDARLFGSVQTYQDYRRRKHERAGLEIYAAFQPFNESTRAFEPALAAFAASLRPGDAILDPWCRSGWSAHWLASLFPEQTIVALWEGDKSVLGYAGFAHWFAPGRCADNIQVMFVQPERSLPFRDGAFAGAYALDAFHRFSLAPFAGEILRTAKPSAVIALAHLHLTNSEPSPYFERGGYMWHGLDYRAWLDRLASRNRRGRVFSELDLFRARDGVLPDADHDTPHYNGFVLIEPADGQPVGPPPADDPAGAARWLLNPLFRISLSRGAARVDGALHDGAAAELLERHPAYRDSLPATPLPLSDLQTAVLALAVLGRDAPEIAAALGVAPEQVLAAAGPLEDGELLRRTSVGVGGIAMQRFHANQLPPSDDARALDALMTRLARQVSPVLGTSDGGGLSGPEAEAALRAFAAYLEANGLEPGHTLAIADTDHPLGLLLALAALGQGLHVALGGPEPHDADLIVSSAPSPGAVALGVEDCTGPSILQWIEDQSPEFPPLRPTPGGQVILMLEGRLVRVGIADLAAAAVSLDCNADTHVAPVGGFGDFVTFLNCLVLLGRGGCVTFRIGQST